MNNWKKAKRNEEKKWNFYKKKDNIAKKEKHIKDYKDK